MRDNPPWPEAVRIVAAVADALSHAHARLIVHRDVKPANIILTAGIVPVLVDFGLALGEEQEGSGKIGLVSGTPWYMSPEQAEGTAHRIDGRTDVYSLGVVLYEMLTGRVPFRATIIAELIRQVRDDEPQPRANWFATSQSIWSGCASRRWRSGSGIGTPRRGTSRRTCNTCFRRPRRPLPPH